MNLRTIPFVLILSSALSCGGQMAIRFGTPPKAPMPGQAFQPSCPRPITLGRADVAYAKGRAFDWIYGPIPTHATSGLVFYQGGVRITVTRALELLGDRKLKDTYFVRLNRARNTGPDERVTSLYYLVAGGVVTLLGAATAAAGIAVDDSLGRWIIVGTGATVLLLGGVPPLVVGGLLRRDGNNDVALGRIMEQVFLSPDLEAQVRAAVARYNARACGAAVQPQTSPGGSSPAPTTPSAAPQAAPPPAPPAPTAPSGQ